MQLKAALATMLVMHLPNFDGQSVFTTDASDIVVETIMEQDFPND